MLSVHHLPHSHPLQPIPFASEFNFLWHFVLPRLLLA